MSSTAEIKAADSSTTAKPVERLSRVTQRYLSNFQLERNRQRWAYGFWFKNRHMRLLAERHNLDWQKFPLKLSFKLVDYVTKKSGVGFRLRAATYKGQSALIVTFVEDDERRRLDRIEVSEKHMDRVRKAMGLPEGTKPKWYEIYGKAYDGGAEDSEDEDFPMKTW